MLLTVQGRGPDSVVITGIGVTVERAVPLTGTFVGSSCGDPELYRLVDVDLDAARPSATGRAVDSWVAEDAERTGQRADPVRFPYEVTRQDAETFALRARTMTCLCSWTARVHWASAGRSGTTTVDNGGRPSRVTADASTARCSVVLSVVRCG